MGKFCLKETSKELGVSLYNAVCPIGSRVNPIYKYGTLAIMYNEITQARIYINQKVLRAALLSNIEKTERLLGIKVIDTMVHAAPKVVAPLPVEEDITVVEEPEIEEPLVEEPEIEEVTESITFTVEVDPTIDPDDKPLEDCTKQELVSMGNDLGLSLNIKMLKTEMIKSITTELDKEREE